MGKMIKNVVLNGGKGNMNQQLYSISDDYNFLDTTMSIALVPVKDFDISEKYIIDGNIFIYPKHSLDTSIIQGCKFDFTFEEHHFTTL